MDKTVIDGLYEELFYLDEQAGCFDEYTNAQIDEQRRKLMTQILELETENLRLQLKEKKDLKKIIRDQMDIDVGNELDRVLRSFTFLKNYMEQSDLDRYKNLIKLNNKMDRN